MNQGAAPETSPTTPPSPPRPPGADAGAGVPAGPAPSWFDRAPGWIVPAIFAAILVGGVALSAADGDFYPNVVWKYYWGPIVSDAWDCQELGHLQYKLAIAQNMTDPTGCTLVPPGGKGVMGHSGYNPVNTASWAILLGLCLVGVAQILRRTKTPMDGKLIVGASGWVVAGSVFHVMEDTHLFDPPLQYFFITPIIYLLFAAFGVLSLGLGVYLRNIAQRASLRVALDKLLILLAIPVLGYFYLWMKDVHLVEHYVHPIYVALCMAAAYIVTAWRVRSVGKIVPGEIVGLLSIGWILLSIAYVISYLNAPWFVPNNAVHVALWAPVFAFLAASLVWLIGARLLARAENKGKAKSRDARLGLVQPIGWLIVFAQTLDGFATSLGIDLGGYHEKHLLSARVINATCAFSGATVTGDAVDGYRCVASGDEWFYLGAHFPTFVGFATLKLALAILVVSVLFNPRSTGKQNATLTGLIAFAIIMVGLGPGIRDFVRMGLGV